MSVASLPVTEFTSGAIFVFVLQQLKRFSWFNTLATSMYTAASAVWALISTLIVSWEWSPHPAGGGTLTVVLPTLGAAFMALWHFIEQFAIQETIYHTTVPPKGIITTAPIAPKPK